MDSNILFFDRRRQSDRRQQRDPFAHLPCDIYHRRRRRCADRRRPGQSQLDQWRAMLGWNPQT